MGKGLAIELGGNYILVSGSLLKVVTAQDRVSIQDVYNHRVINVGLVGLCFLAPLAAVTARKDDAPAAVLVVIVIIAFLDLISPGGGLIQSTSGLRQQRTDRDHRFGFYWRASS